MNVKDRLECIEAILNGLKVGDKIDSKILYDLQLHTSEALKLTKKT